MQCRSPQNGTKTPPQCNAMRCDPDASSSPQTWKQDQISAQNQAWAFGPPINIDCPQGIDGSKSGRFGSVIFEIAPDACALHV
ncbi:hypothetical protein HJFPF1_06944 [Paramyrothecium foliicola]|nr:hypothetical protein HJFPF1_06944 [Paramyrothecium foliicola]